jgi:hypothetical protein
MGGISPFLLCSQPRAARNSGKKIHVQLSGLMAKVGPRGLEEE